MKLAIFGYGGHAREVAAQTKKECVFFVDDKYANQEAKSINDFDPSQYMIIVAVANCDERKKIVERLPKETRYYTFIHPTALLMDKNIEIGEGCFIGAYSVLTCNIKLGKHSILNRGNQIGHDSIIGEYFSAMPGAIVSGNVKIGNLCYLGTNSTIIEKKELCDQVTIGANAVVVKNINQSGTYVGVPTKKIK